MFKLQTLFAATTLFAASGLATVACAQDSGQSPDLGDAMVEEGTVYGTDTTTVDVFAGTDANADSALDRDEFRMFVDTHSMAGHSGATAIKDAGDYDTRFILLDTDADGSLSADELAAMDR